MWVVQVVPKGAPPKNPDRREDVKGHEVRNERCGDLPVVCRDGCWNDTIVNDGAPVECVIPDCPDCVFGNGDVENVIARGGGPAGSAMPQVIGVDVHVVGESEQSGSWGMNVADQSVVSKGIVLSAKCDCPGKKVVAWGADVVRTGCEVVDPWHG